MNADSDSTPAQAVRRWQPLEATGRRVLGVLVEKAKTTPDAYPMTLNSLRTGSNQKNNRAPLMHLEVDQVEVALDALRQVGAIAVVQGSGRVDKYRHLAYDWLGVDKVELAVMAELLLRGAQTIGELRGRAARMEPIKDLGELRPVLERLESKGLIVYLTPPGRGCVVTHALYQDRELEKLRREAATFGSADEADEPQTTAAVPPRAANHTTSAGSRGSEPELSRLREELSAMKREFAAVRGELESAVAELRRDLDELHRQLGN